MSVLAKTLELHFLTEEGRTARVSIENPKEPIDIEAVQAAMSQIIADNVFYTDYGNFVAMKSARVIERNVTDYELV